MEVAYCINNEKYIITDIKCIDSDYAKITSIADVDPEYKTRMEQAQVILRVLKDGNELGFMYLTADTTRAMAVSIYAEHSIAWILMMYVLHETTNIETVRIKPHKKEDVKYYISVATGSSLRTYHHGLTDYITVKKSTIYSRIARWLRVNKVEKCPQS